MNPRSKSLIAIALIFGIDALVCALSLRNWVILFLAYGRGPVWFPELMGVFFVAFTAAAVGILRLSAWARPLGCVLSVANLIYFAIRMYQLKTWALQGPLATTMGHGLGFIILLIWFGYPLYVLTRPKCAGVFSDRSPAPPAHPR